MDGVTEYDEDGPQLSTRAVLLREDGRYHPLGRVGSVSNWRATQLETARLPCLHQSIVQVHLVGGVLDEV